MLLADKTIVTHNHGIQNTNQFSIQQSAKMFNILSNSLYSDKIMAVIRELSTNAYDSHIASNNPNSFRVKLPTDTDPNFTVRDYGTGLSQQDMENLYTTYGASNKNTSNDFVGCLGLGSKSPFAYTKSFTTSSYFNGKKFMYVAAMDETGVPSLNHIGTFDTNEPNGLEITFAVNRYDCDEFALKAKRVFHYFKNKPILEGYLTDHDYSQRNVVVQTEGCKVCKLSNSSNIFPNAYHNMNTGVIAIMGNIAYPVDVSKIIGTEEKQEDHISRWNRTFKKSDIGSWKSFLKEVLINGMYLELDFNIGELEMDPAREGLQYTKDVIKSLRARTQGIYAELKQKLTDQIASAKTKIDAYKNYYALAEISSGWNTGASWVDAEGNAHNISANEDITYKFGTGVKMYVINYRTASYRSRRYVYQTNSIHYQTLNPNPSGFHYYGEKRANKTVFFKCDVKSEESAKKILTKYCNQNDAYAYLLISESGNFDTDFADLIKDVGQENILNVSDYKYLNNYTGNRAARKKNGSISTEDIFLVYGDKSNTNDLNGNLNDAAHLRKVDEDEFDDVESIIYIPMVRYASTGSYPGIKDVCDHAMFKNILGDDCKVYAIKQSAIPSFSKNFELVDFNVFLKNKFQEYVLKHTKNYGEIVNIIEYAEKNIGNYGGYYWAAQPSDNNRLLQTFLNIFGLNYEKYIKNSEFVNALNMLLLVRAIKDSKALVNLYGEKVYAKLDNILKSINCDISFNHMMKSHKRNSLVEDFMDNISCLSDIDMPKQKTKKYDIPKMDVLISTIKTAIDKSPVLKYTIGVDFNTGELTDIDAKNPVKYAMKNNYRHNEDCSRWFTKVDVENLRVSLGNTIL